MATEQNIRAVSIPSSADLSASQFHFVSVDSSGNVALTGANAACAGVLQDKPKAVADPAEVAVLGSVTKLVAGAAFNAGALLMSDSTGRGITATSTHYVNGIALGAAGAAGQLVSVLLTGPYVL